jgi:DNA modification methylase
MVTLTHEQIADIKSLLDAGQDVPEYYKYLLFPPQRHESELLYRGKESEEDILANTWSVPLQRVRTFNSTDIDVSGEWTNRLIFGDNLQVLKRLLDDPLVKGKVKLIYIDPPFATKQEFRGSKDQKAYLDKLAGAEFLEFLRKRIIMMRELLSDDGTIVIHLDLRKCHYVKVLLDEIFEDRLLNEIIWHYENKLGTGGDVFDGRHDTLFWYSRTTRHIFNEVPLPVKVQKLQPVTQKIEGERVWLKDENGKRLYAPSRETRPAGDVWNIPIINPVANERIGYPTQKPEALASRVITSMTEPNDLVLDAFAGSGTAIAVAEKLGRRWIGIDCGKLAIYTIQKRLLNLRAEIGNKGPKIKAKPFTLYNAGLYDLPRMRELPWNDYRSFALQLFQVREQPHKVRGIDLDGFKGSGDVLVFNFQSHLGIVVDEGYIADLHKHIGDSKRNEFFIIAPAASVTFLEDYIEHDDTRYYVLRIPYSIIDELNDRPFQEIRQPVDETEVNNTVEAVGFDFIQPPKLRLTYGFAHREGEMFPDATVKIEEFYSEVLSKRVREFQNRETLSMVMIDYDYRGNGEGVFELDLVVYHDQIKNDNWTVRLAPQQIGRGVMMIYIDIFGNEFREFKTVDAFGIRGLDGHEATGQSNDNSSRSNACRKAKAKVVGGSKASGQVQMGSKAKSSPASKAASVRLGSQAQEVAKPVAKRQAELARTVKGQLLKRAGRI